VPKFNVGNTIEMMDLEEFVVNINNPSLYLDAFIVCYAEWIASYYKNSGTLASLGSSVTDFILKRVLNPNEKRPQVPFSGSCIANTAFDGLLDAIKADLPEIEEVNLDLVITPEITMEYVLNNSCGVDCYFNNVFLQIIDSLVNTTSNGKDCYSSLGGLLYDKIKSNYNSQGHYKEDYQYKEKSCFFPCLFKDLLENVTNNCK
jgi:hypothetical protein